MKYPAFRFDLDARVLGYTFGIALLAGIVFGMLPAFGSRGDLAVSLKERAGLGRSVAASRGAGDLAIGVFPDGAPRRRPLPAKHAERDQDRPRL